MIKAIVFDIDNTLVNFMRMKRHAVDAAVEAMLDAGLPGVKQELVDKIFQVYWREGIENQQIFDKVLVELLGRVDHRILAAGILGYRRAKDAYLAVYPHVHPTLTNLARLGIKMGVVSDAPKLQVFMRIVGLGLAHYFDAVVTFDDTGERKPSPKPFRLVLEKLNVQPAEAIMIGDWAERDMVGAKGVGMTAVFAKYGDEFNKGSGGADYEVMDIGELVAIVRSLNMGGEPAPAAR
ncbi:MAG: HAD-IA family hydrolase [Elusimicrobia bacterium]|nr:HAD-IA family hydrolase [Elusimicrobiota bacterium]